MLLFYVRHGDPCYNPDSLTPLGMRQAESVSKRLALFGIDKVFASTSTRAVQTARPTCELLNLPLTEIESFNEDLADQESKKIYEKPNGGTLRLWPWTHPEYRRIFLSKEVRNLGDHWYENPKISCFREGYDRIAEATDSWLASLGYHHDVESGTYHVTSKHPNERIALFAHEGIGKFMLSHILDIPFPLYAVNFDMTPSGVTVIELRTWKEGTTTARMLTLSNDSHLYRDGLPLNYRGYIKF